MAIANIWKLHSVRFDKTPTDVIVGGMASVGMPTDAEVIREVNASREFARQSHVNFRSVGINVTSWQLEQLLDEVGIKGICIPTTGGTLVLDIFIAKYDCNGIAPGAVHTRYSVNKGIMFPTSMTVDHQGNAQITYSVIAVFDGTNAPIEKAINQALPVIPVGEDERWTMHDATLESVLVAQKKSINIDFGAQANTDGADSEAFDSWVSLDQILPVITFQGIDPNYLGTVITDLAGGPPTSNLAGITATHANSRIRLKERGSLIGASKHVFINYGGNARVSDLFSSTGNDAGRTDIRVEAIEVGANAPLAITTKQIIV